jgi:hypothetical protein
MKILKIRFNQSSVEKEGSVIEGLIITTLVLALVSKILFWIAVLTIIIFLSITVW